MLVDIWRREHPQEKDYTYFSPRHNIHTRIDFILISNPHTEMILSAHIGPKVLTDHVWLDFVFKRSPEFHRSPSWSLNTSLLHSDAFCTEITKETQGFLFFFLKKITNQGCETLSSGMHLKPLLGVISSLRLPT